MDVAPLDGGPARVDTMPVGHTVGFDEFFEEHYRPAVRLATLLVGNSDRAEDVVCDAFARVYPQWRKGRVEDVGAYVRRTVVNLVRGGWRRRAVQRRHQHEFTTPAAAPSRFEADADQRDAMWAVLAQLPEGQRNVVVLRYYEDLSEADTAALLGVSVGTVKTQASRGLARLRELLGSEDHG